MTNLNLLSVEELSTMELSLLNKDDQLTGYSRLEQYWLSQYREADTKNDADGRVVAYKEYRKYFELRKSVVPKVDNRKTYGVVYVDGTEGTIKAKTIEEALELVPEGSQVF
ncbi:MAG: hypothetical protein ACRC92_26235 [Peptostreptococcaceae bacterium]